MNESNLSLLQASVEDAAEILSLQKLAYRSEAELYGDFTIPPLMQTLPQIQAEFTDHIFLKAVAESGVIMGAVRAQDQEGTVKIGRLIVRPDWQGKGIGTRLMHAIEFEFPDSRRFELFTGHRSEGNLRLYRRLGYATFREAVVSPELTFVFLQKVRDDIRLQEESPNVDENLVRYGSVSIAFEVKTRFAVHPIQGGLGGLALIEETVAFPYTKDYDALDGEGPTRWCASFDLSNWGMISAYDGEEIVGGAVIAWNTTGVDMLEGRDDLAVLWDLRVRPEYRGRGIGHQLFAAVADWARQRECRELKIETQNVNVSACRFYARQGCVLRTINQSAYPDLPDEAQLLWYKML